jgi:hypothetical protein
MRADGVSATLQSMLELFQTERNPGCRRVRQRLSELGLDFVARQAPEDLVIPALAFEDGTVVEGTEEILGCLADLGSAECDSTPSSREAESLLAGVPMS